MIRRCCNLLYARSLTVSQERSFQSDLKTPRCKVPQRSQVRYGRTDLTRGPAVLPLSSVPMTHLCDIRQRIETPARDVNRGSNSAVSAAESPPVAQDPKARNLRAKKVKPQGISSLRDALRVPRAVRLSPGGYADRRGMYKSLIDRGNRVC